MFFVKVSFHCSTVSCSAQSKPASRVVFIDIVTRVYNEIEIVASCQWSELFLRPAACVNPLLYTFISHSCESLIKTLSIKRPCMYILYSSHHQLSARRPNPAHRIIQFCPWQDSKINITKKYIFYFIVFEYLAPGCPEQYWPSNKCIIVGDLCCIWWQ